MPPFIHKMSTEHGKKVLAFSLRDFKIEVNVYNPFGKRALMSSDNLSRNQKRALTALLSCATFSEAAEIAGLSVRTLERYYRDPEFRKSYNQLAHEYEMRALASRVTDTQKNTQLFRKIRDDENSPVNARLRAAIYLEKSLHERFIFTIFEDLLEEMTSFANEIRKQGKQV